MNNEKKNVKVTSNVGFGSMLTLLFIALKLCGVITWSWVWVLSPLWITVAFVLLMIVIVTIIVAIKG